MQVHIIQVRLIKMRYVIILFVFLLIPLVFAETTFFDNPDDVFVMGDSGSVVTGGVTVGGTTEEIMGGGVCLYKWNCTDWSECFSSGEQTRDCVNVGSCPDMYKVPEVKQDCDYVGLRVGEYLEEDKDLGGEIGEEETIGGSKIFIYFIVVLVILFVVFYLKRNYFKKLIKKSF